MIVWAKLSSSSTWRAVAFSESEEWIIVWLDTVRILGHLLLYNPRSKNGSRALRRVRELTLRARVEGASKLESVSIDQLPTLKEAPERLVVLGGDGTVNAAAEWLLDREASSTLAIVPAGTGNNLARGLAIPLDLERALELALSGTSASSLDGILYHAEGQNHPKVIIQTSALGFPADIAARYDALRRRSFFRHLFVPTGPYVYRLLALLGLFAQKRREKRGENLLHVRCMLPGEEIRETVFAVFLGNERSLGGNFIPCPRARVDDGAIDLCMVRAGTGEAYLKLFRQIVRGEHLALEKSVIYRQTRGPLEIELSAPSALLADGDLWVKSRKYRFEVLPGRFQVVTMKKDSEVTNGMRSR
jgi:diacylglycerol kinase (ATP)